MMGYVEHPTRWHRAPSRFRHGSGGPLRRDPADRLGGGVASGVAAWKGFNVTTVRIAFVLLTVVTSGIAVAVYVLAWLGIPAAGADRSIGAKARSDAQGIRLAAALASLLILALLVAGAFDDGWFVSWAWPQVLSVAGLVLIWRNAPADEQATMRHLVAPLEAATGVTAGVTSPHRRSVLRLAVAGLLLLGGVAWLFSVHGSIALLRPLGGVALVIAAVVLALGPWWLRIARELVLERQARVRAEERADIAARIHDSVLQTLALIQRRADDPAKVIQLARLQERELRSWLFEGRAPNEIGADLTFAAGVRQIQQDVETRYGVPVEAVTVGDTELDDNLSALLAAAREATVNAAKWSGADVISLFAEVEPAEVSLVVRDRGQGFDPEAVPADRKGLSESVQGRMSRRGGTATVSTAVGEGTKVTLKMPLGGVRGVWGDVSPPGGHPGGHGGMESPRTRGDLGGSSPRGKRGKR
jgi:signal transduction histidine kinase